MYTGSTPHGYTGAATSSLRNIGSEIIILNAREMRAEYFAALASAAWRASCCGAAAVFDRISPCHATK